MEAHDDARVLREQLLIQRRYDEERARQGLQSAEKVCVGRGQDGTGRLCCISGHHVLLHTCLHMHAADSCRRVPCHVADSCRRVPCHMRRAPLAELRWWSLMV
jgi:hypothetical protein